MPLLLFPGAAPRTSILRTATGRIDGSGAAPGLAYTITTGTADGIGGAVAIPYPVVAGIARANGIATAPAISAVSGTAIGYAPGLTTTFAIAFSRGRSLGWLDEWDNSREARRESGRRIPIKSFRDILKAQGNSWADELEEITPEEERRRMIAARPYNRLKKKWPK